MVGGGEVRHGAVDEAGVGHPDGVEVETETEEDTGAEVLDDDIGPGDYVFGQLEVIVDREVQRHRTLVADHGQEVGGVVTNKRRAPRPGLVAAHRMCDLDDVGAEVGQHHGAHRAGQDPGEISDHHASQREGRHRLGRHCLRRYRCGPPAFTCRVDEYEAQFAGG